MADEEIGKKVNAADIERLTEMFAFEEEKLSPRMASLGYCTGACAGAKPRTDVAILKVVVRYHRRQRPFSCPDCSYALTYKIVPVSKIPKQK